jgi:hypothetical protein
MLRLIAAATLVAPACALTRYFLTTDCIIGDGLIRDLGRRDRRRHLLWRGDFRRRGPVPAARRGAGTIVADVSALPTSPSFGAKTGRGKDTPQGPRPQGSS